MRKLAIIVNCTQRKSLSVDPQLSVRTLPQGSVTSRVAEWMRRVQDARPSCDLIEMYNGEAWVQAKLLHEEALEAGFSAELLVASAGLGLRSVETGAPAYAATFAGGHPDTVAMNLEDCRTWWERLQTSDKVVRPAELRGVSVLAVLSESYGRVLGADLAEVSGVAAEMLLVGGAGEGSLYPRLRADRALRTVLGGTVSSLNLRMARAWMARRGSDALFTEDDLVAWQDWAQGARKVEVYDRKPLGDQEVRTMILKLLRKEPSTSATQALRRLRSDGFACEQKRFHRMHAQVVQDLA